LLAFLVGGPVLALFPPLYMMQYTPISDHWTYWGMIPLSIGIAWIYSQRRLRPSYKHILGPLLILIMAALTFHRARDFQSEEQVWLQTIERNPQAHLALHNLGLSALTQGRTAEAIRYLEQALEVAPQVGRVRMNLGVAYERAGRAGDAISTYQSLITLRPDMADPYRPLLRLLIAQGDQTAADELMHQMIRYHPEWMTPRPGELERARSNRVLLLVEHLPQQGFKSIPSQGVSEGIGMSIIRIHDQILGWVRSVRIPQIQVPYLMVLPELAQLCMNLGKGIAVIQGLMEEREGDNQKLPARGFHQRLHLK